MIFELWHYRKTKYCQCSDLKIDWFYFAKRDSRVPTTYNLVRFNVSSKSPIILLKAVFEDRQKNQKRKTKKKMPQPPYLLESEYLNLCKVYSCPSCPSAYTHQSKLHPQPHLFRCNYYESPIRCYWEQWRHQSDPTLSNSADKPWNLPESLRCCGTSGMLRIFRATYVAV